MRRVLLMMLLAGAALLKAPATIAQSANEPKADLYPIIAQLYADPTNYRGKSVVIYGLVIDASPDGSFMLQDVSEHPLKIVPARKLKAHVGEQLMVFGIFMSDHVPHVRAKSLIATKVLGGGGCC